MAVRSRRSPGCRGVGAASDSQTLEIGAEVDGKVLSAATSKVSPDGKTLTATNEGVGPKGPYKGVWVFERVFRMLPTGERTWQPNAPFPVADAALRPLPSRLRRIRSGVGS